MTFSKSIMGTAAAVSLVLALSLPASAAGLNLTLTGASPGGLWSRIGGGIDAAIAKAIPGSTVTYQTSSGGLANVPLVAGGKVPMGIATDGDLAAAKNGLPPFKSKIDNVRILFRAYTSQARFQVTHLLLNKDFAAKHGVTSFADIVNKKLAVRVAINRRGNMDSDVSRVAMEKMGASLDNIKGWGGQVVYAASKEIVSLMADRRIDLANFGISFNHPRVREIAKAVSPVLLSMTEDVAASTAKQFGGEVCRVKPGEYKWTPNGAATVCVGALIIASASMDDATAYKITKALVEQIEEFKNKSHKAIKKSATKKTLATGSVFPFHPGSAKYLKEAGLM
jgi:TRAP transporter TAXI family solute receptor